ncbi:MAG: efflux RND transporter permease subunit [Methylomicrobium sp.]
MGSEGFADMLSAIIRFAIRYPGIVIFVAGVLCLYGVYRFSTAGLDIFPEFSPKQVIIQTEAPGYSAEQVETLVTYPIEASIGGVSGLQSVRSESIQGLSIVTALFNEDSDIYRNRQMVGERLAVMIGQLPPGVGPPLAVPLSSSSATILTIGLHSERQGLMALRSLADKTIVPRLMAVPGVADVNVFGGEVRQLQIQVDPLRLQRFGLSLDDIVQAASQATTLQGGGIIETDNQRFTIELSGQSVDSALLEKLVVRHTQGQSITLSDIAEIRDGPEPPIGAAQILGKPGIVMMVIAEYGANTLTVTHTVEQALSELGALFKQHAMTFYPNLFRPADYIETSLTNLSGHLLIGSLCVLIVLYGFLFDLRTALIAATAIPVSLMSAVIVLLENHVNLNIMVLGGLAIALGEVVDDAIIDTENIFRRLRENRLSASPRPIADIVYEASVEVRGSVVYATLIVALAFVPLLTLTGVAGRLFSPLGLSYILAISMSLLTALTLTPALCFLLIGNASSSSESPLLKCLKPLYRRSLDIVDHHFKIVVPVATLICMVGLSMFLTLHTRFLPPLREGHYIVHTTSIPGTSLQESMRIGARLTERFMDIPGVVSVSQWAGRAERGADTYGSHYSEYEVRLAPMSGAEQQRVLKQLRDALRRFPGMLFEVNTFLTERVDETISGYTAPLVVNIYGNDLAALDEKADAVARLLSTISGAVDISVRSPPGTPTLEVRLRPEQLAFWGLRPAQVMNAVQIAYESRLVGKALDGNRQFDVVVTLSPALRKSPESLGKLPIRTPDGTLLTLEQVADIVQTASRYSILHENAKRRQSVTADIVDRDFTAFVDELRQRLFEEVTLASDMHVEFTGAAVQQTTARNELILHALLAGAGVLVFAFIAIGGLRQTWLTLLNLPFSLIGGVAAVLLTDATISVGSVVGFITLFGITIRNSIMLIAHYRHLTQHDNQSWNRETARQGAEERLPSILMTALVTAMAMLPIALGSDNPGREIMGPMAAIIIGGLVTSTLFNLLLMPAVLLRFGKFDPSEKPFNTDITE